MKRILVFLPTLALCLLVSAAPVLANPSSLPSLANKIIAQSGDAYVAYDSGTQTWEIGTAGIARRMNFNPSGGYRLVSFMNKLTGHEWLAPGSGASGELHLALDGEVIVGASRDFEFSHFTTSVLPDKSLELHIGLVRGPLLVDFTYLAFPNTSVIEQWTTLLNTGNDSFDDITALDSFSLAVRPSVDPLTLYWVQGLSPATPEDKSDPLPSLRLRSTRLEGATGQKIYSTGRSSQDSMGWFVLASPSLHEGIFGGIEWSGAWGLSAARSNSGDTEIQAGIGEIRRKIAPGETFQSPRRFVGFYRGDLDDAANASHQFARSYLMRPRPANFPWTQYNTWFAYYTNLDETVLRHEVDVAKELGLETFYLDAGWYEGSPLVADFSFGLGTWRENREKFPSGLRAFSDYVHSKGMKFGLWVEPERVDLQYVGPGKEIPVEWFAPGTDSSTAIEPGDPDQPASTAQLCLGNRNAREWMKGWLTRIIRDYQLDWLKWDNNIWMSCDPPGTVGSGNYAHIMGLYEVLDYLREQFPNLIIEDCASGGNRMDYALLRRTDIAWLSDETDPSYRVRYHVAGASYPFPPEYLNSWIVESYFEPLDKAQDPQVLQAYLRSRMMGAFGVSLPTDMLTTAQRELTATEIDRYKAVRATIAKGKIYRLLPQTDLAVDLEPPADPDGAEFYNEATNSGLVFLFKGAIPWSQRQVQLKGLNPNMLYDVYSADRSMTMQRTGQQLMRRGINFTYDNSRPSTFLTIKPAQNPSPTQTPRP